MSPWEVGTEAIRIDRRAVGEGPQFSLSPNGRLPAAQPIGVPNSALHMNDLSGSTLDHRCIRQQRCKDHEQVKDRRHEQTESRALFNVTALAQLQC
jgi:hypothetical protein